MDNNAIRSPFCTTVFSFDVTEQGKNLLNRDKKLAIHLISSYILQYRPHSNTICYSIKGKKRMDIRNYIYSIYVLATLGNGLAGIVAVGGCDRMVAAQYLCNRCLRHC